MSIGVWFTGLHNRDVMYLYASTTCVEAPAEYLGVNGNGIAAPQYDTDGVQFQCIPWELED